MNRVPDPLDANERALADLLARDALPGPSPQLDARILAAARSATTAPPSRRPRPRWIAGMGIAATLVLAIGIAWRLRPLPPQHQAASEYAVSAVRVIEPPAQTAAPPSAAADAVYRQVQSQPPPEMPKSIAAERESVPDVARRAAPPEPPVVFDEPSPMDAQAPPPAPPPAPAPAMAPNANGMAAPAAATMQAAKTQAPVAAAAPNAFESARPQEDARTLDKVEVTGSRIGRVDAAAAADAAAEDGVSRAELDEEPPATADSPQVQEAWLQRIRELLSAGETDAARNSLAEFHHRYPKYVLPEDLRSLAAP